jgi:acyl-CoA thioesterase FadM
VNLIFRLAWLALTARFRRRVDLLGPALTPFRVLPTDCDVLLHVNNGVYLSLMDLGRVDLMLRSGMFAQLRARGWYPVVAGQTIQYFKSLNPFDRFAIETRIVGWDERSFYVEQRFLRRGEVVAQAVVRARFLTSGKDDGPRRTLGTAEVLALGGHREPSPPIPEWVTRWSEDQRRENARSK